MNKLKVIVLLCLFGTFVYFSVSLIVLERNVAETDRRAAAFLHCHMLLTYTLDREGYSGMERYCLDALALWNARIQRHEIKSLH